jgi:hypothetical protein
MTMFETTCTLVNCTETHFVNKSSVAGDASAVAGGPSKLIALGVCSHCGYRNGRGEWRRVL